MSETLQSSTILPSWMWLMVIPVKVALLPRLVPRAVQRDATRSPSTTWSSTWLKIGEDGVVHANGLTHALEPLELEAVDVALEGGVVELLRLREVAARTDLLESPPRDILLLLLFEGPHPQQSMHPAAAHPPRQAGALACSSVTSSTRDCRVFRQYVLVEAQLAPGADDADRAEAAPVIPQLIAQTASDGQSGGDTGRPASRQAWKPPSMSVAHRKPSR